MVGEGLRVLAESQVMGSRTSDQSAIVADSATDQGDRRVRPGLAAWGRHLRLLERVHEIEMRIPEEAALKVARELGVTVRSVLGRFGEHCRTIVRAWDGEVEPTILAEALDTSDFQAAAGLLRTRGVVAPSVVIERLLRAAPGPAASRIRAREAARRGAAQAVDLPVAA